MKFLIFLFAFMASCRVESRQTLTSPVVTNWGTWGSFEYCPAGTKVLGAQIKIENWDGWNALVDDTCMNGIRFHCGNPSTSEITSSLTSKVGNWGDWRTTHYCNGHGYMKGFMLRSEEANTAAVDETASNSLRILCSGSDSGFIELDGERWGEWTNPRICDDHEYVCGLQTQVEDSQGIFTDDSSLNNIKVECCDLSKEELLFYGINATKNALN